MLPSISDCNYENCCFQFPQFRAFTEEEFATELTEVLAGKYDDYYCDRYPNWRELNEDYQKILNMMGKDRQDFIAACEALMALKDSFIRHDLYLDLHGGVAEHIPCCR